MLHSRLHFPPQRLPRKQRHYAALAVWVRHWHSPVLSDQLNLLGVSRQPVEVRAMETGKALQVLQLPGVIKELCVYLQRHRSAENPRTPARGLLQSHHSAVAK